jgi:hypothetical protein
VKLILLRLKQFFSTWGRLTANALIYYRQDGAGQQQDLLNFPAATASAKAVALNDSARLCTYKAYRKCDCRRYGDKW